MESQNHPRSEQTDPIHNENMDHNTTTFNMAGFAEALPDQAGREINRGVEQGFSRSPGHAGHVPQYFAQQYPGQVQQSYSIQQHAPYQDAAAVHAYHHSQRPYAGSALPMQQPYSGLPMYQGGQHMVPQQYQYYGHQHSHVPQSMGPVAHPQQAYHQYHHSAPGRQQPPFSSGAQHHTTSKSGIGRTQAAPNSSSSNIPSAPRGPPRKPRQSGNALWVGNLPSGASVLDLKDHFSRGATTDIESVFLISKSNCAFVNYKSEAAMQAAMTRFHDARFQGVRLVCRVRRGPMSTSTSGAAIIEAPNGPAALVSEGANTQTAVQSITQNRKVSSLAQEAASMEATRKGEPNIVVPDKYFVLKSLTVEDMELSVQNKIWATQSHNEDALNEAFKAAKDVFLIFSANKSGEYFGYARMTSPIDDESASGLDWIPRGEAVVDDCDVPRSIPTLPTESAPKGRIIDDSARGTIFWEADTNEDVSEIANVATVETTSSLEKDTPITNKDEAQSPSEPNQSFGKPFKIEWVATTRLPFHRTRGLRNPWNANREVKIARDGTELETSVGRRLIQMFNIMATSSQQRIPMAYSVGQ